MGIFDFDYIRRAYTLKNALKMAEASSLAYESETKIANHVKHKWGFERFKFIKGDITDTQCFIVSNNRIVLLAFRGTDSIWDWLTNINVKLMPGPLGRTHTGFLYALSEIRKEAEDTIKEFRNKSQQLWITGHSLGGALATLAAAWFIKKKINVSGIYTFGQPRVGDVSFCKNFDERLKYMSFRFVNYNDIVTRVPIRLRGYDHIGRVLYFDKVGKLHLDPKWWKSFLNTSASIMLGVTLSSMDQFQILRMLFPDWGHNHGIGRYIGRIKKNMR